MKLTPNIYRKALNSQKRQSSTLQSALFLFFVMMAFGAGSPHSATAQTQVRIIQADELSGTENEFGRIRMLINNVIIETDDFNLMADSVYQYLDLNRVDAFGNIQIETENQMIWSDSLRYNTETDISHFFGRVVIEGENAVMTSQEMIYNFFFEVAEFPQQIRLEDEDGILQANNGFYFSIPDSAAFYGDVQIADTTQYAEADTMYAIRNAEYYELHGNVYLEDIENRTRMRSDFTRSDSTGYRELRGNARLQRVNEAETDTTFLKAEWLEVINRDTLSVVDAYENVRIWSERYASVSDSSRYDDISDQFLLRGNARLWRRDLQLTGDRIDIQLQDDEIHSLLSVPRPIAVTPDSITGRFNQITGDSLWIFFDEGDLRLMEVRPSAEMIIHERDEDDNPDFAVQITSNELFMYFFDGEVDSLKYYRDIQGNYIPEAQNPGEIRLDNFVYEPDLRPQRPDSWLMPSREPISEEPLFPLPERYRAHIETRNNQQNGINQPE